MTKAVRNRILKEANGDINDHLHNHIHLANCIHLKNHMHKQSPMRLSDRSLVRDLIALQRSRSFMDPSASPRSWHSSSFVHMLPKKGDNDGTRKARSRRVSGSSHRLATLGPSKVVPSDFSGGSNVEIAFSDHSSKGCSRGSRRIKREESSRKSFGIELLAGDEEDCLRDQVVNCLVENVVSGNSESRGRKSKQKGAHLQDVHLKTLCEQLNEIHADGDVASSNIHLRGRQFHFGKTGEQPETNVRCNGGGNMGKRQKLRIGTRTQASTASKNVRGEDEMSIASNSLAQGLVKPRHCMDEEEEGSVEQNVTRIPRNGCGIPWNWSRIHYKSKTFLDMAGRSFSCGHSDSRLRKGGMASHGRDALDIPVTSDHSSSSTKSDVEALPLLSEASGSQESADNAGWVRDYTRGLGIYANRLQKNDADFDLASEARSADQHKSRHNHNFRHQNLTQKYMPRTFLDLVGQNLVAQALSNAVTRRKVGLLYVFYGPHGTGKTSCARIFARALNCQSLEHPKPCSYCNSCIAHDKGKSRNIREVGTVSNFDFEGIMDLLDNMIISQLPSRYRIFIFDDCDTLSSECWSAISKVVDRAPRRVVFVLVSSSLDVLPHVITSRCQKFFFPKLRDADIIYTLQWIVSKEDIDIDKDALKLIASRSDGSLRDAEMTLEQLSLLGQKISVPLVQELVGLISDEKLVDLLDLALSADTVNTVKNLRVIMETGIEPLDLMTQLATVITDILAGSYDFTKERHRRKFFRRQPLSQEDMEKLRQALKTLSEAAKQLRVSNDKSTWLTAALLQLAPDQQYMLSSSSTETSFNHSPLALNNAGGRDVARKSGEHVEMSDNERGFSMHVSLENLDGSFGDFRNGSANGIGADMRRNHMGVVAPQWGLERASNTGAVNGRQITGKSRKGCKEIWLEVLEKIQINTVREFFYQEGKLISVSFSEAPTAQLMIRSHVAKLEVEKFRAHILQAFESVLGSPVTVEIRCESSKDKSADLHLPLILPASSNGSFPRPFDPEMNTGSRMTRACESIDMGSSEIIEVPGSPKETQRNLHADNNNAESSRRGLLRESVSRKKSGGVPIKERRRRLGEQGRSKSLMKSKVSLAHVIQQEEGCTQPAGCSKHKAVSLAEKLEQENLRLEPRSRSLLCLRASEVTSRKLSRLKIRSRKPHKLLKLVSCGCCLSSKSPR